MLLFAIAIATGAFAGDLFTIDGVKVSSSGTTAKLAKETAVQAGQREAFAKLLDRIASNAGNSQLLHMEAEKIAELVQGIEVNDEKITARYYSATLNISFNKALIENLLKDNSINFTDKKSAPIVIIPLLIADNQKMLFESDNPLRKALADATEENHVLTIIVPVNLRGVDKSILNQNIEELTPEAKDSLLKLGQNYKADKIIFIAATQDEAGNLSLRLQDIKNLTNPVRELSFNSRDIAAGDGIFANAARGITALLESQWVKDKTASNVSLAKITIIVPVASLDEWTFIHKKLTALPFLKEVSVKSVTVKYALVDFSFSETFENLSAKLAENGLRLENTGDNIILRPNGGDAQQQNINPSNGAPGEPQG